MEKTENPIFGRKIFFVLPPLNIENGIISKLREMEYECYVIKDISCAKPILKGNPDALCFIYIDTNMPYEHWYKFIRSFELDDVLKTVFIGLLSQDISEKKKNFFLLNTNLPGGFVMLNVPSDNLLAQLKGILDVNGAMGRRKFIRLDCAKNKRINCCMMSGSKLFILSVNNISSSGIALEGPEELINIFVKNTTLNNISLTIDRHTFTLVGTVFDSRINNGKCLSVMILKNYKLEEKNLIRNFIFSVLDEKFETEMNSCMHDMENYETFELPKEFAPFGSLNDYKAPPENSFRKQIEDNVNDVSDLESV